MRKECEYIDMDCYRGVPIDSLDCAKCLMERANECSNIAEILIRDHIKKRDEILEGFEELLEELKEWLVSVL